MCTDTKSPSSTSSQLLLQLKGVARTKDSPAAQSPARTCRTHRQQRPWQQHSATGGWERKVRRQCQAVEVLINPGLLSAESQTGTRNTSERVDKLWCSTVVTSQCSACTQKKQKKQCAQATFKVKAILLTSLRPTPRPLGRAVSRS